MTATIATNERITSYHMGLSLEMYVSDCPTCGAVFAIMTALEQRRREDGADLYCPNGHVMTFGASEADRARNRARVAGEQLEAARALARRESERRVETERSRAAYKAQATKLRRRAAHGVCPCCTRTFQDLARHVASQHPDFVERSGE